MRFSFYVIVFTLAGLTGFSQEVLTGLQFNPVVKAMAEKQGHPGYPLAEPDTTPEVIPFFDDFSSSGIFPSQERWIDKYAFENDDLPVFPVNIGAMTMDAINDSGNLYPEAVPGPAGFIADHLTSRYIRLDSVFSPAPKALTPADSVYLSFYYQPQGRGKAPQKNDSLVLEFLVAPAHDTITPTDTLHLPDLWRPVWFANGMPLDTFYMKNNKWFVQVMIPVTDTVFFSRQFRFRFFNYVSLASLAEPSWQSNTAQWNLDNVYLNQGRNRFDTVYPELRFVYRPPSLLKRYQSMPYPQYCNDPTNEIKDTIDVLMNNRDITAHMSTYNYYVTSPNSAFSKSYSGGSYNILPYTSAPYVTYQKFAHPAVPFLFPISQADSSRFLMKHVLKCPDPSVAPGDSIQAWQDFYDYYAYDDGTPEASYGLTPAGSQLAYRFRLNNSPDTLRAIRFYFNRTLSHASEQFFYLCVWNENAGKPGDTIYSDLVMPRFADSINKFVTYHLIPPLPITGTFYVGWIQTTDDNLSVGFDRYDNSQQEIFWNSYGTWNTSSYSGSLMIRPVVGKPIPLGTGDVVPLKSRIDIYPNPCNAGLLHVRLTAAPGNGEYPGDRMLFIRDLTGRVLISETCRSEVDVSTLKSGMYLLEIKSTSGVTIAKSRIIIAR